LHEQEVTNDEQKYIRIIGGNMMNKEIETYEAKEPNYIAVTNSETGEVIAHIDLRTNETIMVNGIDIRLGFGEPTFIDVDGKIYMKVE